MNERIRRLRESFVNSQRVVDIERAVIVTRVFKANEEKSPVIKKALAFDAILSEMTIALRDDELIVGNQTPYHRGGPLCPEYAVDWILEQMETFSTRKGDRFAISESQITVLKEVLPYWKGRTLRDKVQGCLPPEVKEMLAFGIFGNENFTMSAPGHMIPDHETVLKKGLIGIRADCEGAVKRLRPDDLDYGPRYNLYTACATVCTALIRFAERYAERARELAQAETDDARRKELLQISENCLRVPAHPAENFWEAMQCIYFIQVGMMIEGNGLAISLGRPDQTLFSYYEKDLARGRLTREDVRELIACFYLKINEIDKLASNEATTFLQGPAHGQTITLSGVTRDGKDATNDLSHLFLEADLDIRLVQPDLAIRVHRTIPQDFLVKACVNVREGLTKPKFFNDEVVIQSLLDLGVPLEEARDWGSLGCSEPVIIGKTNSWGNSGHLNLAKCLELAINNGKCMLTGKQMGPETGNPEQFGGIDAVLGAFEKQVAFFIQYLVIYDNIIDGLHAEIAPVPLYSILTRDCLKEGVEFNRGGARYNFTSPLGVGPVNVGDSLAAMDKLVFEENAVSMGRLLGALKNDFDKNEDLRQMLINRAPKFGNDDDRADQLCNEVLKIFCDTLRTYRNRRNGPFIGGLYYLTANIPFGQRTAATPDGRKSGEPLNDGGISPVHGRDKTGFTAVAKSIGKLDNQRVPHGLVLNQRMHPGLLDGNDMLQTFSQYIRTFMDLGGWHTQFNIIRSDTLRDAQTAPDDYKSLVIRVAGYSAYFTQLTKDVQNDIIERTEHTAS
jgi:pyruvate formate-lyase/glycerol dehydratase family glycyl radical enzyme